MNKRFATKIRVLLATAVLGLLFLSPITPVTYAADCSTGGATGCGG